MAEQVLTAARERNGAGVCQHAGQTLLKLISEEPEFPASAEECAEWVPDVIDSYGDPPAVGSYDIPVINFSRLSDGVTEKGLSASVMIRSKKDPDAYATVSLQQEEGSEGWRLWQCCDFVPKNADAP